MTITIEEARTQLEELVKGVESAGSIVVERNGQPLGEIVILTRPTRAPRKPGSAKGKVWMAPDFDEPLEEFKSYM